MAELSLRPEPGEEWRAYRVTPYGPGPVTSLVQVLEVVQDLKRREIVRYRQVYPTRAERVEELPLEVFVVSRAAPDEDEMTWMRRYRESGGRVSDA